MKRKKREINYLASTEYDNDHLALIIGRAIGKTNISGGLDFNRNELSKIFRLIFDEITPQKFDDEWHIRDRKSDIKALTQSALQVVAEIENDISKLAFFEMVFYAVASASASRVESEGENEKAVREFRMFADQLKWIEELRRERLEKTFKLHGAGGDTRSKFPWRPETCALFKHKVDKLQPLWNYIMTFYREKKKFSDWLDLLKQDQKFKELSRGCNEDLIFLVISRMRERQRDRSGNDRRDATPLALACDHAAFELNIHPQNGESYSLTTLLRYYHDIKREIENGSLTDDSLIIKFFAELVPRHQS